MPSLVSTLEINPLPGPGPFASNRRKGKKEETNVSLRGALLSLFLYFFPKAPAKGEGFSVKNSCQLQLSNDHHITIICISIYLSFFLSFTTFLSFATPSTS